MIRPDHPRSVCLDSCCVIALLGDEQYAPAVESVVSAASEKRLQLFASTLVLVEARGLGANGPHADPDLERSNLARLEQPHWLYVETDRAVALKARALASRLGLKAADAVHLASAIVAGAEVFMTLDKTDYPIGTDVDGVWIDLPYKLDQPQDPRGEPLFDSLD